MESKRAFIHIGLAKTGTKSIQFALAQRRSKLSQAGWVFPLEGTSSNRGGHHGLAWHLQGASHQHPALRRFDVCSFRCAIAAAAGQNIVISSEELSLLRDESAIRSLLSLFPTHEVYVVAYVREQAELLNSLYVETLELLDCLETVGGFVARDLSVDGQNYQRIFRVWRNLLGRRLVVRPFDPDELRGGDVVKDFAALLEIEEALHPLPIDHKNVRLNPLQVASLLGFAQNLVTSGQTWSLFSERHRHLRTLIADILNDPDLAMAESYWGIGAVWVQRIREHYRASNAAFFAEVTGAPFCFSAARRVKRRNAVAYRTLAADLRTRLERKLLDGLQNAPGELP